MTGMRTTLKAAVLAALLVLAALPSIASASRGDRDDDGMKDRWEQRHKAFKAKADPDRDKLSNRAEFRFGSNPRKADTDDDGLRDAQERRFKHDPRNDDSDDDGIDDGDERAGTVAGFADGVLTIRLATGGEVSGLVDERTEIECEDEDDDTPPAQASRDGDDDDDHADDHGGRRSGDDDDHDERCGTEALTEGRLVEEAELELSNGKAWFEEIELVS
jgi:hypothetical protein